MPIDDDLDTFFEDDLLANTAPEPTDETQKTPNQPEMVSISKADWEQSQQQVRNLERWQQDMIRTMSGQPQTNQPDPKVEQELAPYLEKYSQAQMQHMQQQMLISEYRAKNPDIVKDEPFVAAAVQQVYADAASRGQRLTDREALEAGIQLYRSKFQPGNNPQNTIRLKDQALQMDINRPAEESQSKKIDVWALSPEKFKELDRRINREMYR